MLKENVMKNQMMELTLFSIRGCKFDEFKEKRL